MKLADENGLVKRGEFCCAISRVGFCFVEKLSGIISGLADAIVAVSLGNDL